MQNAVYMRDLSRFAVGDARAGKVGKRCALQVKKEKKGRHIWLVSWFAASCGTKRMQAECAGTKQK